MARFAKTKGGCRVSGTLPDGQRVRRVLRGMDTAQAREWWARESVRAVEVRLRGEREKTFREAVEAWLVANPKRMLAKEKGVKAALVQFGDRPLGSIAPGEVRAMAERLWPDSPHSVVRWGIAPVRAIFNHAAQLGWCQPMKVKGPTLKRAERRVSDAGWRRRFWEQSRSMGPDYVGLAEMVALMSRTGLRTSEACALTWPDVVRNRGTREATLKVGPTKNGRSYEVELPPDLSEMVASLWMQRAALLAVRGVNEAVKKRWRSNHVFGRPDKKLVWTQTKEVCARAGIEKLTPHEAGRHTFATRLMEEKGWSPAAIARAGRWEDAGVVVSAYLHSARGTKEAAMMLRD